MTFSLEPQLASTLADAIDPPNLRFRIDPVAWARARNIELWSKQEEIMQSVVENENTSVGSCHGIGKSFTAALTTCWWLDTRPVGDAFVVTTAPTDKQVKAILWREINKFHSAYGLAGRTNLSEWYIGNELVAFGRKPSDYDPTAFQGIHALHLLVVIDEACGIPKDLWDAVITLATGEHSRILAIGNPDDEHSEFRKKSVSSDWHHISVGYQQTPNFTGEPVSQRLRELLITQKWVNGRRNDWGEGSALFTSKCLGQFPHGTSPYTVIPISWIERCRMVTATAVASIASNDVSLLRAHNAQETVEAGIDVAAGGDRTVVMIRRGHRFLHMLSFREADPIKSAGAIALALREWNVEVAKIDPIGVGWGLMGALRDKSSYHNPGGDEAHAAQIIGVNFAEKPAREVDQPKYLNKRAQAWWHGRELCRTEGWDISGISEACVQELSTPLYEIVDSNGKVKIQKKDEIIDILGRSPDEADALLLAYWEASWETQTTGAEAMSQNLLAGSVPGGGGLAAVGPLGYGGQLSHPLNTDLFSAVQIGIRGDR